MLLLLLLLMMVMMVMMKAMTKMMTHGMLRLQARQPHHG